MPQFSPGQSKIAIVPATVQPSGLSCHVEVFLGPNDTSKVASSGLMPFTSSGGQQNITAPITMPSASGTYHVYIDLYVGGVYLAGYQATEDVEVVALGLNFGAMSASRVTCPSATAYSVPVLSCSINNPNSQVVTQTVKLMWKRYSHTYSKWYDPSLCSMGECHANPFSMTLNPGQTVQFSHPGYCSVPGYDEQYCSPLLFLHYTYYFWLEDAAGNKSSEASIYIP